MMQVAPFPQPHEGQELGLTQVAQLILGQLPDLLVVVIPQLEQGQKIGLLIPKPTMFLVGCLLFFQWPLARILHGQRGDDDEHLAQTAFPSRRQQHAA